MQTSLARRQRHRRALQRRPQGRTGSDHRPDPRSSSSSSSSSPAASSRGPALSSPWAPTTTTPPACPIPRGADQHRVRAADGHLRPDRQDRARPPRRPQARGRHLRPAAGRDHRRDDRDRGQGLLEQRRASTRSASSRPASTPISRPAARRLHDHPAARPRPAPAAGGVRGLRPTSARSREIIQSIRLTQAYPGRGRQAADHHRLPQPELLRQPELRREGRGQGLLRQVARRPDPRPGRHPRGHPPVADEVRPDAQRRGGLPRRDRRRRRGVHELQARRAARTPRSSSAATRSST